MVYKLETAYMASERAPADSTVFLNPIIAVPYCRSPISASSFATRSGNSIRAQDLRVATKEDVSMAVLPNHRGSGVQYLLGMDRSRDEET